ncbi:MAG: hypothetical protein ACFFCQ_12855, partial [Promethearchaeota archaeon]
KEYSDCIKLFVDIIPEKYTQEIVIWREKPIIDQIPPFLSNFKIYSRTVNQNWNKGTPELITHTFMRLEVEDDWANVYKVNASVHLHNNQTIKFVNMQNPIFWKNSTYGRVLWKINEQEVDSTQVMVQDGFGNTRYVKIYSNNSLVEQRIRGNEILKRLPDKRSSSEQLLPYLITSDFPKYVPELHSRILNLTLFFLTITFIGLVWQAIIKRRSIY